MTSFSSLSLTSLIFSEHKWERKKKLRFLSFLHTFILTCIIARYKQVIQTRLVFLEAREERPPETFATQQRSTTVSHWLAAFQAQGRWRKNRKEDRRTDRQTKWERTRSRYRERHSSWRNKRELGRSKLSCSLNLKHSTDAHSLEMKLRPSNRWLLIRHYDMALKYKARASSSFR